MGEEKLIDTSQQREIYEFRKILWTTRLPQSSGKLILCENTKQKKYQGQIKYEIVRKKENKEQNKYPYKRKLERLVQNQITTVYYFKMS